MVPVPKAVPSSLHDKLTIVCVSGKDVSACPTTLKGAMLEASSRSFGGFAVRLDTIPPTVKAANFSETKPLTASVIKVKIADNLTGVVSYSCHVNGEWQLAEHDGKTATLSVSASSLRKGTNRVTFTISDGVGNTTKQTWKIIK